MDTANAASLPGARPVRAPRGTGLSCRGWPQEAAMRMLMNNLDPEVAEHPDQLVVYGGSGRAARSRAVVRRLAPGGGAAHAHEQPRPGRRGAT